MKTQTETAMKEKNNNKNQNPMREIQIEKMVLNCGGIDDKLEKSVKLLEMVTKKKAQIIKSRKRIPTFGISPGKKSGCKVTLRNKKEIMELAKRLFAAVDNKIAKKQITKDYLSFGIKEYIEIPGLEYNRDIGIIGLELSIVFKRKGKRTGMRKIKQGRYPEKQHVTKEEIIDFVTKQFKVEVVEK